MQSHASGHKRERLVGIVELFPPKLGRFPERDATRSTGKNAIRLRGAASILLLRVRDVQKSRVGSVEEGDTKRKPEAHDPKLSDLGHQGTIDVASRYTYPVHMKQKDCTER